MAFKDFKSPKHKIIALLTAGREKWKTKHHAVKKAFKLAGNQVRAVTNSREKWRDRALGAERRLRCVQGNQKKRGD